MKIYLDDERKAPEGYVLYTTGEDMLEAIQKNPDMLKDCEEISLDYQLCTQLESRMSGEDVLKQLIQLHANNVVDISDIRLEVHSKHPTKAREMRVMIRDFRWNK